MAFYPEDKKAGRPQNQWKTVKRTVPEPAITEFEIWLAKWKAENKQ